MKQWHCIDYAIMRKTHRRRYLDVTVVCGAQCNTDRMMVKVKVQIGRKTRRNRQERQLVGKFDVSRLQGENVDKRGRKTVRGKFVDKVCEQ